jgi:hypothetical protein
MDGFEQEVLRRLPLAQSSLSILAYVLNEPLLDAIFAAHRGRGYEGLLTFPTLVYLVRDALLIHEGHGLPSFQRAAAAGELPVLTGSVYPKLARMEMAVSKALLRESGQKMLGLIAADAADAAAAAATATATAGPVQDATPAAVPASLAAFQVIAFDGKTIKRVRRQLKALRPLRGALLGGKLLVAQDVRNGLALAMGCCEDAERNDVPLVPDVVQQVRGTCPSSSSKLWMGDRQFCDLNLMGLLDGDGDGDGDGEEHFLIRMNRTLGFTPDPGRPAQPGIDARGRRYTADWGWVGGTKDKRRRYVRRITLRRPDADDDDLILLSDLLDERRYPAADLLDTYRLRWGIEQMFQQVTEVFALRQLIGCTPRANIFQAAFCFVIYNAIQVMRGYVARAGQVRADEVSTAKLFDDVRAELIAHGKLGAPEAVSPMVQPANTAAEMRGLLSDLLADQWVDRWRKTPGNPRRTRGRTQHVTSGRTSVFKALEKHRAKRLATRAPSRQRR